MQRRFQQTFWAVRLLLLFFAVFSLSIVGVAAQESGHHCCQQNKVQTTYQEPVREKPATACAQLSSSVGTGEETVKLDDLIDHQDEYLGKTITTEGEMHRVFNEHSFTIEDDDWLRDDDVLIITKGLTREEAVTPMKDSIDPGHKVRVTGFVRAFDQAALECEFGPLDLESREGHSFTKSPVLIVQRVETAKLEAPPVIELEKPEPAPIPEFVPAPPPAPIVEPLPESPAPPVKELPRTAGGLPMVELFGLLSLLASGGLRYLRR